MMKQFLQYVIIMLIGIHLVVGGMTRIHHHSEDDMICFCIDGKIDPVCDHHHGACDHQAGKNDDGHGACHSSHNGEDACAFHIDDFNLTDDDDAMPNQVSSVLLISILATFYESPNTASDPIANTRPDDNKPDKLWLCDTSGRRGPPCC